jgi:hypothetical protein
LNDRPAISSARRTWVERNGSKVFRPVPTVPDGLRFRVRKHLPSAVRAIIFSANSPMKNVLMLAGVLASSLAMAAIVILALLRRRAPHSNSTKELGTVSQHWLTAHRAER